MTNDPAVSAIRQAPRRWMIRVTNADGDVMHLRHGAKVGFGAIVKFRTKKDAEINVELLANGMDDDERASVVPYDKSHE